MPSSLDGVTVNQKEHEHEHENDAQQWEEKEEEKKYEEEENRLAELEKEVEEKNLWACAVWQKAGGFNSPLNCRQSLIHNAISIVFMVLWKL